MNTAGCLHQVAASSHQIHHCFEINTFPYDTSYHADYKITEALLWHMDYTKSSRSVCQSLTIDFDVLLPHSCQKLLGYEQRICVTFHKVG